MYRSEQNPYERKNAMNNSTMPVTFDGVRCDQAYPSYMMDRGRISAWEMPESIETGIELLDWRMAMANYIRLRDAANGLRGNAAGRAMADVRKAWMAMAEAYRALKEGYSAATIA